MSVDNFKYICNVKKSPRDKRDFILKTSNKKIPEELDLRIDLQPIRNQGKQGTCYAQATACMKEWQEKKDNGFNEYLSPQFFYNNRPNKYDDNRNNDEGMYGRDVMKLIKHIGICRESTYPYGKVEHREKISEEIFKEAIEYRINTYAKINSIQSLKESLYNNGPCLIAFPVYNYGPEFWKKTSKKNTGGHAVTIVGYTLNGFIIRNSWGSQWGENGYSIYNYNDWGSHWEIWTTTDIDNDNIYIPSPKCCNIL